MKTILNRLLKKVLMTSACIISASIALTSHAQAPSDSERKESAAQLIDQVFTRPETGRAWVRDVDTASNHWGYVRYESNQIYCTNNGYDCWHITLHVHPEQYKVWDTIYAYSYTNDTLFLGEKRYVKEFSDVYDLVREEINARPACHKYCHYYEFTFNDEVIIRHNVKAPGDGSETAYGLRVLPSNMDEVNISGGLGQYAQWETILTSANGSPAVKFRSKKSGKYLRIEGSGLVNVKGTGGSWTAFVIHPVNGNAPGQVKLQSAAFPAFYLVVTENGVVAGNASEATVFTIQSKNDS